MTYQVIRYFFRYGRESDPIECTFSRDFDSFDKALRHGQRYANGIRFAAFEIEDSDGNVVYEMTDTGLITDYRKA
jgi:uncharacterized membrane protein YkoI